MAAYQRAVAERLRDPDSARFDHLRLLRSPAGDEALCGTVNSRNGFGGYTGPQAFYAEFTAIGGGRFIAHLRLAEQHGALFIAEKCAR